MVKYVVCCSGGAGEEIYREERQLLDTKKQAEKFARSERRKHRLAVFTVMPNYDNMKQVKWTERLLAA